MKYRLLEDPGHAWLEVPVTELERLGIAGDISSFSYLSSDGKTAYLEEDCDLSTFCRAKGWTPANAETHWTEQHHNTGFVRNLPSYRLQ